MINCGEAARRLSNGEVVALPTDTLFGLAARLESAEELYRIKGRDGGKPLIILGSSVESLLPFTQGPTALFKGLAATFWPGALTLVVEADLNRVPAIVRANTTTIGLRIPAHAAALELLSKTGPLVVTSCNRSGEPPLHSYQEIEEKFGNAVAILDGQMPHHGVASTVVLIEGAQYRVLRPGAVSDEAIGAAAQGCNLSH